jgi:hypothetical protein
MIIILLPESTGFTDRMLHSIIILLFSLILTGTTTGHSHGA